jgi:hypothetical protein
MNQSEQRELCFHLHGALLQAVGAFELGRPEKALERARTAEKLAQEMARNCVTGRSSARRGLF